MIQRQEEEAEKQLLAVLREQIPVDESSVNFNVRACFELTHKILATLHLYRSNVSKATFMTRDSLEEETSFVTWTSGSHRFLLIGGITNKDLMGFSWMTPAVLALALEWESESSEIFAFFSGRPGGFQHSSRRKPFTHMLLGVVLQVVRQVPSILREDEIRKAAVTLSKDCSDAWTLGNVKSLAEVIGRFLIKAAAERQLRIVVDRLDQIEDAEEHAEDMLKCLDHLVVEVPSLKLLVTWSLTDHRKHIEDKLKPLSKNLIYNLGLDLGFY